MIDSRDAHREDLKRYGMDPDPWGRDEDVVVIGWFSDSPPKSPLHPPVADGSWGESSDPEDGEA